MFELVEIIKNIWEVAEDPISAAIMAVLCFVIAKLYKEIRQDEEKKLDTVISLKDEQIDIYKDVLPVLADTKEALSDFTELEMKRENIHKKMILAAKGIEAFAEVLEDLKHIIDKTENEDEQTNQRR